MVGLTGSSQSEYVKTFVTVAKEEVLGLFILHASGKCYSLKLRSGRDVVCSTTEAEGESASPARKPIARVTQLILAR